jgi:GNAT superfamily N-acetyltransferase
MRRDDGAPSHDSGRLLAANKGHSSNLRSFRGVLQHSLTSETDSWISGMNSVEIEETSQVTQPLLRERVANGKRLGTREFVVLIDGQEAGLLIFEALSNGSFGLVYEIYVLPEFRGMGVGNLLLSRAETVALDSACNVLRLSARSLDQEFINDESLMSWYGRKGFTRNACEPGWMQKNLTSASTIGGRLD